MNGRNSIENPFLSNKSFDKPKYKKYQKNSYYVPMRDGIRIAIDIVLPDKHLIKNKIPAILYLTRYWRSYGFKAWIRWLLKEIPERQTEQKLAALHGYAFVKVDVRGTGASFGTRSHPWSEDEVADYNEIIDWIISQSWSDGNIIAYGSSYSGVAAELVATLNHSAVKGIIPMHNYFDLFSDIAFPGGIYNQFFISHWANIGRYLDRNSVIGLLEIYPILKYIVKGVVPVSSDKNESMLKDAIQQHSSNIYVSELAENLVFRDDRTPQFGGKTIDEVSVFSKQAEVEKSMVPFYSWGGWLDGTSADVVITRFINYKNPHIAIIGDWNHSVRKRANIYFPKNRKADPSKKVQFSSCLAFSHDLIKENKIPESTLFYYTMGEEKWKKTNAWPPERQKMQRWYFNENNILSQTKPQNDTGEDSYKVDFESTTGKGNRWYTNIGMKTSYQNRRTEDRRLLIYNSYPLEEDMEITGHPIISLFLASTHEDGAIFAYLEEVDEIGEIFYLTEGLLRLIHRKVSPEKPPYDILVPYHSYKKNDSMPMVPHEISEVTFGLLPTSVLIRKNHQIRIAIAGADKDTFDRYPEKGVPTIKVARNKNYASFIVLPIIVK
jgi:putative CocE/NonD family hydrolase